MPKPFRLIRRRPVAVAGGVQHRLKRFSADAELGNGEALSFLSENFDSVIGEKSVDHWSRASDAEQSDRGR
ncbi:hypothetical protein [Roseobacter sinensis]|uniref:Uncharacterized protein n=1 Tax=Roseobacter sinensis TaxID=2931391 RepID=A0ABT3BAV0_9RHOB|nr:hypothetical protein [Roseobacter sp. WL0113]MCV3270534.1 hypothetical protein [Roseobacter sp. WL0113]